METLRSPETLADRAYEALLDAICDGTLKPGERLTQADVAARLNVSRQPIHNALLILKAQGFVRENGRRGVAVAPIDTALFRAIYELRSAIEPLTVKLAGARLSPETLVRARELIANGKSMVRRRNIRGLIDADMNFHMFLYELSGNPLIVETMRLNWKHLRRAMGAVLQVEEISFRVWTEHASIVDALADGKIATAATRMRQHIEQAYSDVALKWDVPKGGRQRRTARRG